jgi:DNA-binding transcriptional LysR family regulator
MSTALARLRRHYQDELLVRVGRDYELTPFAKALVPSVQQTMQLVDLALDTGQRFDPATSRHAFRIDATDYAITVLAEPLLRRLAAVAPGDRVMDELCVRRQVQVMTTGFLPLPFLVTGTDLLAVVPERLALRVAASLGLAVVEPPFGRVELIETLWWHPDRAATPEHAWLRRTLTEAAAALPPVAAC